MQLSEATDLVWKNAKKIDFGQSSKWDDKTFLKGWFDSKYPDFYKDKEGWYWFIVDMDLSNIRQLKTPSSFPKKGCRFGETAATNIELFDENICHQRCGLRVVYNGHQKEVFSRIRTHFALADDTTGALGIYKYPSLSSNHWQVRIFQVGMIESISDLDGKGKTIIRRLIQSETGRRAVEAQWRAHYGWPILCKS